MSGTSIADERTPLVHSSSSPSPLGEVWWSPVVGVSLAGITVILCAFFPVAGQDSGDIIPEISDLFSSGPPWLISKIGMGSAAMFLSIGLARLTNKALNVQEGSPEAARGHGSAMEVAGMMAGWAALVGLVGVVAFDEIKFYGVHLVFGLFAYLGAGFHVLLLTLAVPVESPWLVVRQVCLWSFVAFALLDLITVFAAHSLFEGLFYGLSEWVVLFAVLTFMLTWNVKDAPRETATVGA